MVYSQFCSLYAINFVSLNVEICIVFSIYSLLPKQMYTVQMEVNTIILIAVISKI